MAAQKKVGSRTSATKKSGSAATKRPRRSVVGTEAFPTEAEADPEDGARDRRHPEALAQYDPASPPSEARPVEDEGYGSGRIPSSGTLSNVSDEEELSIKEPGLPVDSEHRGRQFLSNATQQDNFESERPEDDSDLLRASPLGHVISEASLEMSGQEGTAIPDSQALDNSDADDGEPPEIDFDLRRDYVREASLFDQPTEDSELGEVHEQRQIESDDTVPKHPFDDDRTRSTAQQTLNTLRHGRGQRVPPERVEGARRGSGELRHPRRTTRHAAHVIQTSRNAARLVADITGLEDPIEALTALEVVVSGIARRLTRTEAGDFLAQLPSELRQRIAETVPPGPDLGLTRETIEADMARRLHVEAPEAARLVTETGTAIEHLVSQGEIAGVRAQLPRDLQSIFSGEVAHRTP